MDRTLHAERIAPDGRKPLHLARLADLPDGAMIAEEREAWLVFRGQIRAWSSFGYTGQAEIAGIIDRRGPDAPFDDPRPRGRVRAGDPSDRQLALTVLEMVSWVPGQGPVASRSAAAVSRSDRSCR
jgi:hypothetical protein